MPLANERVAWFNGRIVRESEVLVPFRDQGFLRGDAVFDMTRSFNGKAFRLAEHVARLYRSLKYLDLDPGLPPAEMVAISEEVLDRNRHLLGPGEDYWLAQRISRGIHPVPGDNWDHYGPNVIVECVPLPLRERAKHFRDGIDVVTPSLRRTPPELAVAARQDAPIFEPGPRRPRGEGAEPGCLGGAARRQRQPRRGAGQQHLSGPRRRLADPPRTLRASRGEPPGGDRPRPPGSTFRSRKRISIFMTPTPPRSAF